MTTAPNQGRTSGPSAPLPSSISVHRESSPLNLPLSDCKPNHADRHRKPQHCLSVWRRRLVFSAGELRAQLVGNGFSHLALDRKDVGHFAIEGIGPKMG